MSYQFEYETLVDLGSGDEEEIQVTVDISVSFEKHYGADADGNRGNPAWFCELEGLEAWRACGIKIESADQLDRVKKNYEKYHSTKHEQEAIDRYEDR